MLTLVMLVSDYKISISKREIDVLQHLADGFTSKEIGCLLGIAECTVITYRDRLREKFECKNCPELVYKASKLGFI